jgi:opacity protein-like surface antigen
MSSKSLFASVLLLSIASIAGMASTAQAADISIPLSGTIAPACEFTESTGGSLATNGETLSTQLSSKNKGGEAGLVTIRCNTSGTVYAKGYDNVGKQKFEVSKATYTVSNGKEEGEKVGVSSGSTQIGVNLTLDSESPIPAGDYAYNVIVTATP